MKARTVIIGVTILICLIIVGAVAHFLGGSDALNKLRIAYATPDQLAKAMSDDDFYGNWRESTLVVQGSISDVSQQGNDTVLHFKTDAIFQTYCNIGNATTSARAGDAITVIAEGLQAERLTSGVELMGCQVLQ